MEIIPITTDTQTLDLQLGLQPLPILEPNLITVKMVQIFWLLPIQMVVHRELQPLTFVDQEVTHLLTSTITSGEPVAQLLSFLVSSLSCLM